MNLPVCQAFSRQWRVLDHEQVLRVMLFRRHGEIEARGDDGALVDDHVRDVVFGIHETRDAGTDRVPAGSEMRPWQHRGVRHSVQHFGEVAWL